MPSFANEPLTLASAEGVQITELRRSMERGAAKLVPTDGRPIELPSAVHELLLTILKNLEAGKGVSVVPENRQVTTQRAANLLGVSRPFLVKLLEDGEISFHKVGSHRRVYLKDLLAYKQRRDGARRTAIDRMAKRQLEDGTYDTVVLPADAEDE